MRITLSFDAGTKKRVIGSTERKQTLSLKEVRVGTESEKWHGEVEKRMAEDRWMLRRMRKSRRKRKEQELKWRRVAKRWKLKGDHRRMKIEKPLHASIGILLHCCHLNHRCIHRTLQYVLRIRIGKYAVHPRKKPHMSQKA